MDKQQKKEQSTPMGNSKDKIEIVYFNPEQSALSIFSALEGAANYFHFTEPSTSDFSSSVFHPPLA